MKHALIITSLLLSACSAPQTEDGQQAPAATESLKLYVLDCGRIDMLDLALFDQGGAYDGRTNKAANSCFMIRHPKGDLLWDAGLPDALAAIEGGVTNGPFHIEVPRTLASQISDLGMTPADIEFFSVSHSHFDHLGNGGQYAASTFLVHEDEYAHMFRDEARADSQQFPAYSALEHAKTIQFRDTHDVFGDGSVEIITTPGHTPGHTILKIELINTGTVLLSGDLYHLAEAREKRTIPVFNTDAPQTLKSMDQFEALAAATNAKVIIQHSTSDFDSLPKPPQYLD